MRHAAILGSLLLGALVHPPASGESQTGGAPATQPAASQGVGDIDLRDYCTVLLARKLQDHLQVTDEQRARLQEVNTKLKTYLHTAAGNIQAPRTRVTPGLVAGRAETALGMAGKLVRQELTPAQRAKLVAMFDDRTLEPIGVGATVSTNTGLRSTTVISGVDLTYTHFGEKAAGKAAASGTPATPATAPTAPTTTVAPAAATSPAATTGPVAGSPRSRRTEDAVDVPTAIEQLASGRTVRQVFAAAQLARAVPEDAHRAAVLKLLRPAVKDTADPHWLRFVQAYCVWADAGELDAVKGLLPAADASKRMHQKEEASAAACAALVRLEPKSAVAAINERLDNGLFRTCLLRDLNRLANTDDPAQNIALDLHKQLLASHGRSKLALKP